jgi:hypothetical protein
MNAEESMHRRATARAEKNANDCFEAAAWATGRKAEVFRASGMIWLKRAHAHSFDAFYAGA